MKRAGLIFLAMALVGCNQPSPQLWGARSVQTQAAGYDMTLWRLDNRVEIIRHGYAPRRDQPMLRPAMAQAIVDVTGCALRPGSLEGDTGVLRATLNCG